MASVQPDPAADLGFLFTGGVHQAMHIAPVALALAKRTHVAVTGYAPPGDVAALRALLVGLDPEAAPRIALVPMAPPWWSRGLRALLGHGRGAKPIALIAWRRRLLRHHALVAAERTSTLLKRWPGRRPVMIHIPHGAGDRAQGFDPRIRLFDHVLVNGPMVLERTLAQGDATAAKCEIIGSVKLSALTAADRPPLRLFDDDRPTILYNPHFDTGLSSWGMAEALCERIAVDGRFSLIVAPHARLGERLGEAARARWRRFGERPGVLVDLASDRLGDMTYTRAADLYLGDVSSQVYEFLHRPRPVVFVDAHGVDWRDNIDYRMWTLGDVAGSVDEAMAALHRATERHARFRDRQASMAAFVLGPVAPDVPGRAADAVLAALGSINASNSAR